MTNMLELFEEIFERIDDGKPVESVCDLPRFCQGT